MAVVLDEAGEVVLCARVKTKFYTMKRDNGYEVETIEKLKVLFHFQTL